MSTPAKQNFRTDAAVVGPIENAASDMTGGDVFVILATIPTPGFTTFLYALGYSSVTNTFSLLAGGLGVYLTGNGYPTDDGDSFKLPYFKYKKPVSDSSANYDEGDNYYNIGVYSSATATSTNYLGTLNVDIADSILTLDTKDTSFSNAVGLGTDDAYTFPGLPSLMSGVGYYFPDITSPENIQYRPSNSFISAGDYAGLPDPTVNDRIDLPPGTRFYFCPLQFFSTSSCTDSTSKASNLIYYQCPRTKASTTPADLTAGYYTKFCGNSAVTGLTTDTLCQLTNGTIPYYAYANGVCGDVWPSSYALNGMDGLQYTANSTYGMSYDGLCLANDKTTPTAYKTFSLQDAYDQLISEGDIKPPTPAPPTSSGGTPWWMWLLLVLLIIGIIVLALMLFMNMKKPESKTHVNADGNVETIKTEEK